MATPIYAHNEIKFFEGEDSSIQATVGDSASSIPVEIPDGRLPSTLSTAQKLEKLLTKWNFLVQNDKTKITFAGPTLEKTTSIPIPKDANVYCGLSGSIFYTFVNTLFQWNPTTGMALPTSFATLEITSLAEFSGGQLLVGDKDGNIHFPNTGEKCNVTENEIDEILPLSPSRCIIYTKKNYSTKDSFIYDVETKQVLQKFTSKPHMIGEDCFLLDSPSLSKWTFNGEKGTYEKVQEYNQQGRFKKQLSDTHILLSKRELSEASDEAYRAYLKDETGKIDQPELEYEESTVVFDLLNETSIEYDSKELFNAGPTAFVNSTLFYAHNEGGAPHKRKLGIIRADGTTETKFLGSWGVTALTPLSDETCLCAKDSADAKIFILSDTGEILFDDQGSFDSKKAVQSFHKLPDGSILAILYKELWILKVSSMGQQKKRSITDETFAPSKRARKEGRIRSRLFVGEGSFTGVYSLIKKHKNRHPDLAKHITATELGKPVDGDTRDRIRKLQSKGVPVYFGIDGTKLHETFPKRRFERIHWNHPFGDPNDRAAFKEVLSAFFLSCSHLQLTKDRVHVTLEQKPDYWKERQVENLFVKGATEAGYRLIHKRDFGPRRYPGYEHNKTDSADAHVTGNNSREFVFEKTGSIPEGETVQERAEALRDPAKKEYEIDTHEGTPYFECDTDYDSSSYEE